eukprot:5526899-Ditylum_brightwellii.AAC.1
MGDKISVFCLWIADEVKITNCSTNLLLPGLNLRVNRSRRWAVCLMLVVTLILVALVTPLSKTTPLGSLRWVSLPLLLIVLLALLLTLAVWFLVGWVAHTAV